jgi:predicted RNA-binding Zn-ribbon protein involved in translation (DUF1610 family)
MKRHKNRKNIPQEAGTCPHCGEARLDYDDDARWECDSVGFLWKCEACGKTGTEWHGLEFVRHG